MPTSGTTDDLDTTALAAHLRLSVTRLARQLRQTTETTLTPSQTSVLATTSAHGPLTLGELAEREQVASPTISKVIGVLCSRGLVSRATDPGDRRFVRVELTAEGIELLERSRARKDAWLARRLRELDRDELERLASASDVLDRLVSASLSR